MEEKLSRMYVSKEGSFCRSKKLKIAAKSFRASKGRDGRFAIRLGKNVGLLVVTEMTICEEEEES